LFGESGPASKMESNPFWEAARDERADHIAALVEHPCIIAWDLSNEWYCYAGYFGADPDLMKKRFKSVSDAVEKRIPPAGRFSAVTETSAVGTTPCPTHYMQLTGWKREARFRRPLGVPTGWLVLPYPGRISGQGKR